MLIGFDSLKEDFKKLVIEDRLFHAYLFFGPSGTGKSKFIRALAHFIEKGKFKDEIEGLKETMIVGKKTEDDVINLGIDEARDIKSFLYQKPIFAKYKCVVIQNADKLTSHAQNALLKILEEAPEHNVVLASTNSIMALTDTFVSRVNKIYIPLMSDAKILDFIVKYGRISEANAHKIVKMANGKISRAINIIDNDNKFNEINSLADKILSKDGSAEIKIDNIIESLIKLTEKNNNAVELFLEELLVRLKDNVEENVDILGDISNTIFFINSVRGANKKIHLKNILWKINTHLQQSRL